MTRYITKVIYTFIPVLMLLVFATSFTAVFASATYSHPADTAKKADCSKNQQPVQIPFGSKNAGKWYCVSKNQTQGGGAAGGGSTGGGSAPANVGSNTPADQAACNGLDQLGGTSCGNGAGQSAVGNLGARIVNIISYVAGGIAIIMILVAGIRYMTSGGDANKISAAKTALIYALIGIAVVGASQVLIHLVLGTAAAGL